MGHPQSGHSPAATVADAVSGFHGVLYRVTDVGRAVDFYTNRLGFKLERQQLPEFGVVALDSVKILLSGPGASGSRPLLGGESQAPGGPIAWCYA